VYFSFAPATAEIFLGRGVAYCPSGSHTRRGSRGLHDRAISRTQICTYLSGQNYRCRAGSACHYDQCGGGHKHRQVPVGDRTRRLQRDSVRGPAPRQPYDTGVFRPPQPNDPFANASSSQREALFYTTNPSAFDSSPMAYRDEVSNNTAVLQAAIQSDRDFYKYVILSGELREQQSNHL